MSEKTKNYLLYFLKDALYTFSIAYFLWKAYYNFLSGDIFGSCLEVVISLQLLLRYGIDNYLAKKD